MQEAETNPYFKERRFVDRSDWPDGPWDGEPDNLFVDTKPLPLLVRRNRGNGALFGGAGIQREYEKRIYAARSLISPGDRPLEIVDFDDSHQGDMDTNLIYVGWHYIGVYDLTPMGALYLKDIPSALQGTYKPTYTTVKEALAAARKLSVSLVQLGLA